MFIALYQHIDLMGVAVKVRVPIDVTPMVFASHHSTNALIKTELAILLKSHAHKENVKASILAGMDFVEVHLQLVHLDPSAPICTGVAVKPAQFTRIALYSTPLHYLSHAPTIAATTAFAFSENASVRPNMQARTAAVTMLLIATGLLANATADKIRAPSSTKLSVPSYLLFGIISNNQNGTHIASNHKTLAAAVERPRRCVRMEFALPLSLSAPCHFAQTLLFALGDHAWASSTAVQIPRHAETPASLAPRNLHVPICSIVAVTNVLALKIARCWSARRIARGRGRARRESAPVPLAGGEAIALFAARIVHPTSITATFPALSPTLAFALRFHLLAPTSSIAPPSASIAKTKQSILPQTRFANPIVARRTRRSPSAALKRKRCAKPASV